MFFSNSTRREKFCGKGAKPVEAVRKTHPQGMWRRLEPVHRSGKRGKLVHRGFSTCPQNPVERGCCRFPGRMNIHSLNLNAGCGEGPLPRGQKVRHPAGGRLPGGGRRPSGGKDHFFFCGKRNGPSPQRKRGARSMQGLWTKTAASGFRMTAGTPSGRYGLPFGNRDSLRPTHPPPAGASLRAGVVRCIPCGGAGDLVGRDDPGAPPHSAARAAPPGGPRIEPRAHPCSTTGRP